MVQDFNLNYLGHSWEWLCKLLWVSWMLHEQCLHLQVLLLASVRGTGSLHSTPSSVFPTIMMQWHKESGTNGTNTCEIGCARKVLLNALKMCYNCWWKWDSLPICAGSQCQLGHGESGADFLLLFPSFFSQAVWGHGVPRGHSPFVSILHLLMKQCNCKTIIFWARSIANGENNLTPHLIPVGLISRAAMWFLPPGRVQGWRANPGPSADHQCVCRQRMCWQQQDRMWWDLECWGSQHRQRNTTGTQQGLPSLPNGPGHWDVLESAGMVAGAHVALSLPIACLPSPQIQPWPVLKGRVLVTVWPQWLLIYQDLTPSKAVFAKWLQTWSGKHKRSLQYVISWPKLKGWKDVSSLGLPQEFTQNL